MGTDRQLHRPGAVHFWHHNRCILMILTIQFTFDRKLRFATHSKSLSLLAIVYNIMMTPPFVDRPFEDRKIWN